jgi:DsbC/DsbD-like thiol-disulfide interchange protein
MKLSLSAALGCALLFAWISGLGAASAAKKPGEAVRLQEVKIKGTPAAGAEVIAVLSFAIDEGYHTHSNKPSEPNFIATVLTVPHAKGVTVGTAVYPKGKSHKVEGLDKPVSLFEEQFTISIPIKLEASATLPLTLPASLRYQACQGATCYPPKTLKLEIPIGTAAK